jgi:FtsZ-binding cell division protein ZapB
MSYNKKNTVAQEIEAMKKDMETLAEQNAKLQRELEAREEVMQSLFSYFTTVKASPEQVEKSGPSD